MPPQSTFEDRFWSHVNKDGPAHPYDPTLGPCWRWTASTNAKGYGRLGDRHRRVVGAHRVGWELAHGPIPNGLSVLHSCDNPPCVRASHLFLGTAAENNADMVAKGRLDTSAASATHAAKTHCPQGHAYDEVNTYTYHGHRQCRACHRAVVRAARR